MDFRFLSKVLYLSVGLLFSSAVLATTELPANASVEKQIDVGQQDFNHGRYEDALAAWCDICGKKVKLIACIEDPVVIKKIHAHFKE